MSRERGKVEDALNQNEQTEKIRSSSPRKSKAKELVLMEEFCVFCYGSPSSNDEDFEELLRCSECLKYAHPSCLEMPVTAIENTKLYNWECNDCKGCFQCRKKTKEKLIILCDYCDRGFHTFCLERRPTQAQRTSWKCPFCDDKSIVTSKRNKKKNSDIRSSLKDGSRSSSIANDGKVMVNQKNSPSALEPVPNNMSIEPRRRRSCVEEKYNFTEKELSIKNVVVKDNSYRDNGLTETYESAIGDNVNNMEENSFAVDFEEKKSKIEITKSTSDKVPSEERTDTDVSEIGKTTDLESVSNEGKSPKKKGITETVMRRFSRRLSSNTWDVLAIDGAAEKDEKTNSRFTSETSPTGKTLSKVSKDLLPKRKSSRLSHVGFVDANVRTNTIKEEEILGKQAEVSIDDIDKVTVQEIRHKKEEVKPTTMKRGRNSMMEKANNEEDGIEDSKTNSRLTGEVSPGKKLSKTSWDILPKRKSSRLSHAGVIDTNVCTKTAKEEESIGKQAEVDTDDVNEVTVQEEPHEREKIKPTIKRRSSMMKRVSNEEDVSEDSMADGRLTGELRKKSGDILPKRKSTKLSHVGVTDTNISTKTIKEEERSGKQAEVDKNDVSKVTVQEVRREMEEFKSTRKRRSSMVEKVGEREEERSGNQAEIDEDDVKKVTVEEMLREKEEVKPTTMKRRRSSMMEKSSSEEDLPLVSYKKVFVMPEDGKEKVNAKENKSNAELKCDEEGEKNVDVESIVPVKRKRGRPRKYPLKQEQMPKENEASVLSGSVTNNPEQSLAHGKDANTMMTRESRKSQIKGSKGDEEENIAKEEEKGRRVLRKTSREPAISPTKARSILSGKTPDKVYPLRTDLEKSPAMTRASKSTKPKGSARQLTKTITKSSEKRLRSSVSVTSSKTPSKTEPIKSTTKSDRKSSDSKLSARKKDEKSKSTISTESVPKRKLSFEEKPKEAKKEKQDAEVSQRPKRRSMAPRKEEETSEVPDNDVRNFVSSEDIALFEEAQKMVNEGVKKKDSPTIREQCIKTVHFGEYEIDTWYASPYPSEYRALGEVFVCEYCLKYMKSATILRRHRAKCGWRHPPGDEIYRKDKISVFEVDGKQSPTYCQSLCLFAKLFLDHKTLYYEVEPFLFYVMTVADNFGCHMVGYFSKEKVSFLNYNVSCILVLPHCMRKGYGKALIDFSYLLSRVEGKVGSPERPLSDLGLISYRSYWKDVLLRHFSTLEDDRISIKEMSQKTSIMSNDLISTMQYLGILKYWKGQHFIIVQKEMLDAYVAKYKSTRKFRLTLEESKLSWTPVDYGNNKNKTKVS